MSRKLNVALTVIISCGLLTSALVFVNGRAQRAIAYLAAEQWAYAESLLAAVTRARLNRDDTNAVSAAAWQFERSLQRLENGIREHQVYWPFQSDSSGVLVSLKSGWSETKVILDATHSGSVLEAKLSRLVQECRELVRSCEQSALGSERILLSSAVAVIAFSLVLFGLAWRSARNDLRRIADLKERAFLASVWEGSSAPRKDDFGLIGCTIDRLSAELCSVRRIAEAERGNVQTLIDGLPAEVIVVSGDLRILNVNAGFCNAAGCTREQVAGRRLEEVLPEPGLWRCARTVLRTGIPRTDIRMNLERATGERTLSVGLFTFDASGEDNRRLVIVSADVTERETFRTAFENLRERYERMLHSSREGIIEVGPDGIITEMSSAAEKIFACGRAEAVGEPLSFLLPEVTRTSTNLQSACRAYSRNGGGPVELEGLRQDGTVFPLEARFRIWESNGNSGCLALVRDITLRKQADLLERDRVEVIELLAKNRPLKTVLDHLTRMVERRYPGSLCTIWLRRSNILEAGSVPSLPQTYVGAVTGSPINDSLGACAAALEGKTVVIPDIAASSLHYSYRILAASHNLRSSCSVPLYSSEGVILGVLEVYFKAPRQIERAEIELFEMASRLATLSVEYRQLTDRLSHQAQHDALTGLANRLAFEDRLESAINHARRHRRSLGMLHIDLDRFKLINDTLGHAYGDGLLRQLGQRLKETVRESDTVARLGGDEFAIILPELHQPEDAALVAQKLLNSLRAPFPVEGRDLFVTGSIGISLYPEDGTDAGTLLRNADAAMYRAKGAGKNGFQRYLPELSTAASERLELENQLRRAIEREELALHYQPQFELTSGRLVGLEALLRWNHPDLGLVPPSNFIPVAEDTGLIIPIGDWVLHQACRQIAAWQRSGRTDFRVAVNVSALQFSQSDFVKLVAAALRDNGVEPRYLELELTESMVMRNPEESAREMGRLRSLGVRVSIDDFGTGYSSLCYLQRLPIDALKIDQSFVKEITADSSSSPLIHSIVALGQSLRMDVIAEGVEYEWQLRALRDAGCNWAQGFLLGRPSAASDVEGLLRHSNGRRGRPRTIAEGAPASPGFLVRMPMPRADNGRLRAALWHSEPELCLVDTELPLAGTPG